MQGVFVAVTALWALGRAGTKSCDVIAAGNCGVEFCLNSGLL